jgi:PKD repeat protein
VADFSGSPTSGEAPLTVHFTDLSSGNPISWGWDFNVDGDDGGVSFAQNPSYTYEEPGQYSVMLQVMNGSLELDIVTKYSYITVTGPTVNIPPTASFTYTTNDLDASFTDTSTDSDGSVDGWSWDFGDGTESTAQNPSHTYAASGKYVVTLTVTDDDGDTDSTSQEVTVSKPTSGGTMYVNDLQVDKVDLGRGNATVKAFVVILDEYGDPVSGATVTVEFTGAIGGDTGIELSGDTGSNGEVTITASEYSARNPCKTTGRVTLVQPPSDSSYVWDGVGPSDRSW